jgi:steroid delta-isomerase
MSSRWRSIRPRPPRLRAGRLVGAVAFAAGLALSAWLASCGESGSDGLPPAPTATPAPAENLTPAQVRGVVETYVRSFNTRDTDLYVSLFAPGGRVEDPVGKLTVTGPEELAAFFDGVVDASNLVLDLDPAALRISGNHVAFPMLVRLRSNGVPFVLSVIDTMDLDADGKILVLRAYYSPSDVRPEG